MPKQQSKNQISVNSLRTGAEKLYLVLVIIVSILIWAWIFHSIYEQITTPQKSISEVKNETVKNESGGLPTTTKKETAVSKISSVLTTPVLVLIFLFLQIFSHFVAVATIRMNAIKVGPDQFPEIWKKAQYASRRLGIQKAPSVFVITGAGALNAFATRLVSRKLVVIFSELANALIEGKNESQLDAVLGHEIGHHALGHTHLYNWLLFGYSVPFLGSALSRAREYSADRAMKALVHDKVTAERALVKLVLGKNLGRLANIESFLNQRKDERGFFAWLSEKLATHPHLPNRIAALRK